MPYPPPHQASRLALAAQVSLASFFLLEDPLGTADLKQAPAPPPKRTPHYCLPPCAYH